MKLHLMHCTVLPVLISFSEDNGKSAHHFLKSFNLFLLVWILPPGIFNNIVYSFIIVNDRKAVFQISTEGQ